MRRTGLRIFALLAVILLTALLATEMQAQSRTRGRSPERSVPGKARNVKVKEKKVREPRGVRKAKKKQEDKEDKIKRDYKNYVSDSKKRAFKIQTPEVQERMKSNSKEIKARDKARKKQVNNATKSGSRKYR
jgi:hypothetical protein